jgi:hypothetical protein
MRTPANIREYEYQKARKKAEKMTLQDEISQHNHMIKYYKEEIVELKDLLKMEFPRQKKESV